jgi:hypothetical protein
MGRALRSRCTLLFERLVIDVLHQCDVSGTTRILRISRDEAWGGNAAGGHTEASPEAGANGAADRCR